MALEIKKSCVDDPFPGDNIPMSCSSENDRMIIYKKSADGKVITNIFYSFYDRKLQCRPSHSNETRFHILDCSFSSPVWRMSVLIENVSVDDSGEYLCSFYIGEGNTENLKTSKESLRVFGISTLFTSAKRAGRAGRKQNIIKIP